MLRGIGFRHAVNNADHLGREPAVTFAYDAVANLLVEDCAWRWNNFNGHNLHGRDLTFRDCDFSYNGYGGIGGGAENVLLEGCSTSFNNWRGLWGDQIDWNMAGIKFHGGGPVTLRRHVAVGNLAHGIWFDINPHHVRVEDGVSAMNYRAGLFFELSDGPHLALRCLLVHNREQQFHTAVFGRTALRDSVCYGDTTRPSWNHDRLPFPAVTADQSIRRGEHAERNAIVPELFEMNGNVIAGGGRQEALLLFVDRIAGDHPAAGRTRLVGGGNLFAEGRAPRRFVLSDGPVDWRLVGLDSLVERTGLTPDNRVGNPGFIDPAALDFRVAADGPLAGRAELPLRRLPPSWIEETRRFYAWAGASSKNLPRVPHTPAGETDKGVDTAK